MIAFPNHILLLAATIMAVLPSASHGPRNQHELPVNILAVTVDDMNWNSVGAFGNPISDITPHIDMLAREGRRFERAYVAASNCAPSRIALQTGLYPQQTGATGFFYIDDEDTPSIATELRDNGYYTGLINKASDTNASPDNTRYWDFRAGFEEAEKYSSRAFGESSAAFFNEANARNQPFYLVVNIADPHKPNFNDREAIAMGADAYLPSRIISESEVTVPAFLPDLPEIRRDIRNYYNSVRRADDTVGEIMDALRASGLEANTLVIFLSDHGMPFPFAKSSVYDNGLRTPLIMRWPNTIEPGGVETGIVSVVDLMPTILDVAGAGMPAGHDYLGRALLAPSGSAGAQYAFGSFDENAQGYPVPMRGALSDEWSYVFNAWSDGEHTIRSAAMYHASFRAMQRHARTEPLVQDRLDYFRNRPTEELCRLTIDPDCLVNLADDPAYSDVLAEMQSALRAHMVRTDDYLLEAFDVRDNREQLRTMMRNLHEDSQRRAERLRWRRGVNLAGNTRANRDLFRNDER